MYKIKFRTKFDFFIQRHTLDDSGCHSMVGRTSLYQELSLDMPDCGRSGIIQHEVNMTFTNSGDFWPTFFRPSIFRVNFLFVQKYFGQNILAENVYNF